MKRPGSEKQLLIAESELNRLQLLRELAALGEEARAFSERAQSFGAIATSAATIVTGLAAYHRGTGGENGEKPSRLNMLVKGAGMISSLWQALRPRPRPEKEK